MCFHYKAVYADCPTHIGRAHFFPCANPQTCWPKREGFLQLEQHSEIAGSCIDLPDFCPLCLAIDGTFEDILSDEARGELANHPLYRDFHVYDSVVKQMWERVESHPAKILVACNEEITDRADRAPELTLLVCLNLYHLLAFSFWREVIADKRSPSIVKRKLLVQMHMYLMSQAMREEVRKHLLEEAHKSIRPNLLMTILRSVALDDLADEDSNCTICLQPLSHPDGMVRADIPVRTPCGHIFGTECICTWIKDNTSCPNCRRELLSLGASQSLLASQQAEYRAVAKLPIFIKGILGLDSSDVDPDVEIAIIAERGLKAYLLHEQEEELIEKTDANAAGLASLDSSGNYLRPTGSESD